MTPAHLFALVSPLLVAASVCAAEDRRERVLSDRREVEADGRWIYNDFSKALATAAEARKPVLVVLRCVP